MKKAYMLALLFLASCALSDWQTFAVDKHVTVQLPEQPKLVDVSGMPFPSSATRQIATSPSVRVFSAKGNSCVYGIIVNSNALPAVPRQPFERDLFYTNGIQNVLEREHNALLARSTFFTRAGKGVEVTFSNKSSSTNQVFIQHLRTVLVGRASYTFSFLARDDNAASATEQRHRFFNSITVKP
ncbi:hypothetical protein [Hymenobacter cheonanensis]|uniref:hypothetical protein n=1 Tax=Hymenobacter sp. CA2-7 TaxID=3063993 RepID=UPI0027128A4F|nr:hypothetical protein [Hymenobacter sp. CA2-7]MDO7884285.1 hypothetical protein [Hymenobacter sp. CA2-7]